MTTFAHTETGQALDPRIEKSKQDYYDKSSELVRDDWIIIQVPDGTQHGAKDNGDGTFSNPAPPPKPQPAPVTTKQQILDQITILKGLADQLA